MIPPRRCDIVVYGLGLAGRLLFQRLAERGVDVVGYDPRCGWVRPGPTPLWAPDALALLLPCHLELPSRFLAAMGTEGVALLDAVAPFLPAGSGVTWTCDDPNGELAACRALGLPAAASPLGFHLLGGGIATDALVGTRSARPAEGELTVLATPWSGDAWLSDKVMPVRWQSIGVSPCEPTISRAGSVFSVGGRLCGARWASPHAEVGETEPVANPRITQTLERLAGQDGLALDGSAPVAGIVAESCDGLPIVGPIPGRPRVGVLTGLGICGRTYLPLAVAHLAAEMLGDPEIPLPRCLGTARFR